VDNEPLAPAHWIRHVGEGAVLIRFGTDIDIDVNTRVLAYMSSLDKTDRLNGVYEVLPAYSSLLVHFDPLAVSSAEVEQWLFTTLSSADAADAVDPPRTISIPVRYGGKDGPDIEEAAKLAGLESAEEVAKIHSEGDYRVYFLGFMGGFPYLGGLPESLASVPRLQTPRQKVPAGTVGIAAGQTGVYTLDTPGGWHLLGATSDKLFDPTQDPPAMLRAGDLIKFVHTTEPAKEAPAVVEAAPPMPLDKPWMEVVSPGPMTTVQDIGRHGYARHGVSRSGAADELSLRMGNSLLGNEEGAAALEVTLGMAKLRCLEACSIALTGADCGAKLKRPGQAKGVALTINQVVPLRKDDVVELGLAQDGSRAYVCVQGGVDVPEVLGSRSTDVRGGLGGFDGRMLQEGDSVGRLPSEDVAEADTELLAAVHDPLRTAAGADGKTWKLRVLWPWMSQHRRLSPSVNH